MAQENRQIQSQAQSQVQTLSPQQMLAVKLIELPIVEMEQRVRDEILDNPALEEVVDEQDDNQLDSDNEEQSNDNDSSENMDELADYLTEDDIPEYKLEQHLAKQEDAISHIPYSEGDSFVELLTSQLHEQPLDELEMQIGEYLIGTLDDDGLLHKPLDVILDDLEIYANIPVELSVLENILKVIQSFDPPGIGARNLQECLLIQLERKPETAIRKLTIKLLSKSYDAFVNKHWEKIKTRLKIDDAQVQLLIEEVKRLTPKPGIALGEVLGKNMQQIVPDFIVDVLQSGKVVFSLNSRGVPPLQMSRSYTQMIEEHINNPKNETKEAKESVLFVKRKLDAAQGFINAVNQRRNTLRSTMQAIIDLQLPFFQEGDESLIHPMILKDVAEITGLDISTISRVSNSKYCQTPYGIFSLKYFFNDSYITSSGEEHSVLIVKNALQEIVDGEDKKHPYSDERLAVMLEEKGLPIARRTVAKYRQQLNIPVARLRK
ncbi:MAG: RNA polymerase factor sigma-54 [Bacteroidaceae bacterium]